MIHGEVDANCYSRKKPSVLGLVSKESAQPLPVYILGHPIDFLDQGHERSNDAIVLMLFDIMYSGMDDRGNRTILPPKIQFRFSHNIRDTCVFFSARSLNYVTAGHTTQSCIRSVTASSVTS